MYFPPPLSVKSFQIILNPVFAAALTLSAQQIARDDKSQKGPHSQARGRLSDRSSTAIFLSHEYVFRACFLRVREALSNFDYGDRSTPQPGNWLWSRYWTGLPVCVSCEVVYIYSIAAYIYSFVMMLITFVLRRYNNELQTSEVFSTAGRTVKSGLVASAVVSSWTWAATRQ